MDVEVLAAQVARLRRGRTLLVVAVAAAVLALLGTLWNKPVLSVVGWAAAVLAGVSGIGDTARALGTPVLVKLLAMLGALMPALNVPLLAGFAWHGHRGLAGLDEALRRESAREQRARRVAEAGGRPAPAPAPAPATAARPAAAPAAAPTGRGADARKAIAHVKSVTSGPARDEWCEVNLQAADLPPLPAGSQPLARVCGGQFIVVYLVDEGSHLRYVTHDDLAAAGMSRDELHATGLRNLEALIQGQPGLRIGREGAIHGLLVGGHFEASLVLLNLLWDGPLARLAPHGAVVALPARDICAFCDARSPEGIAQLRAMAQRVTASGDHLITPHLLRRVDGRWSLLPD